MYMNTTTDSQGQHDRKVRTCICVIDPIFVPTALTWNHNFCRQCVALSNHRLGR